MNRKDAPAFVRGSVTRARNRELFEKSILLEKKTAYIFAAAMRSRPDIASAQVRRNHCLTGTPARWYVRWLRSTSLFTLTPSLCSMQDIRAQRAALQANEMEFIPNPDRPGWFWTIHHYPDSDECGVYQTHPSLGCTCPDYEHRCGKMMLLDKHQLALAASLPDASPIPRVETAEEKAARRERLKLSYALDFG